MAGAPRSQPLAVRCGLDMPARRATTKRGQTRRAPARARPSQQWRCPRCRRSFGHPNQSHVCAPALALDEYLVRQPAEHAVLYRAALARLAAVSEGDLDVDPVNVGIMVKRARTFCELRPKRNGVELSFKLSREIADPRIRRVLRSSTHRIAYFVLLRSPEDVDDQLAGWLAESYLDSPR